jgi:hypothetical protein
MSGVDPKQRFVFASRMSALGGKADITELIRETTSNWFLEVRTPFWPEAFLYIGRAIDLA